MVGAQRREVRGGRGNCWSRIAQALLFFHNQGFFKNIFQVTVLNARNWFLSECWLEDIATTNAVSCAEFSFFSFSIGLFHQFDIAEPSRGWEIRDKQIGTAEVGRFMLHGSGEGAALHQKQARNVPVKLFTGQNRT